MHGIMIGPAIEVGWLDILLAQQSGYLRTMINGVVNGLDHHNDGRSLIGSPVKIEYLTQVPLLRNDDQLFSWTPSRFLCKHFVEAACKAASTKCLHKNRDGVLFLTSPLVAAVRRSLQKW